MNIPTPRRLTDFSSFDVLVQRTAKGGFGLVYMGPDQMSNGDWFALKTLRPELLALSPELSGMFLDEALIWMGLWPHANLLTAQAVTEIEGRLYLVLDYAQGGSLRDLLTLNRPFSIRLLWAQMVAAGLLALHTPDPEFLRPHPLVHRDLKPENVLVEKHGYAQITDFGLALAVEQALAAAGADTLAAASALLERDAPAHDTYGATRTRAYTSRRTRRGGMGTLAYMPPEQWQDGASVGTPADMYAFGLILSELLAGQHGLLDLQSGADEEAWYAAHTKGTPCPLRTGPAEGASRLPEAVEQLYQGLLAKRPEDRPTAQQALAVLQQAGAQLGEQAYTPPDVYPRTPEHLLNRLHKWAGTYKTFERYAEALERNTRALAIDPTHVGALLNRATILTDWGEELRRDPAQADKGQRLQEEGLGVYAQALAATPAENVMQRKRILASWGMLLSQMGHYAEADARFVEALAIMPDTADTWFNRGLNELRWGRAEHQAGHAGEAHSHWTQGQLHVAEAQRLNPHNESISQFDEYIQALLSLDPTDPRLDQLLAQLG